MAARVAVGGFAHRFDELAAEHGVEAHSTFSLANFMRTQLSASLATLRVGVDVLQKAEGVQLDTMFAHGGLFTTKGVAQSLLAAAIDTPVSVGEIASEGGAWEIAVSPPSASIERPTKHSPIF